VVAVNVAVVAPPATVTVAGTVTEGLLLDKVTTKPVAGAALVRVTVPVEDVPPTTDVGFRVTVETFGAVIARVAFAVLAALVAVTVPLVSAPTARVVAEKVAVVAPAATVTVAGTVILAVPLLRLTTKPPVGAALEIVTVPVEEVPPTTEVGEKARAVTRGAVTPRVAVAVIAFAVPVIVAVVSTANGTVVIGNVTVV
jgi:hypothetical protein